VADVNWETISALSTGVGTLVLAVATFASVRSANRAARTSERALMQGLRPLLFPSRLSDEPLKVSFVDQHWLRVPGGQGAVEATPDVVYLAMSLRNVGSGLAVLDSWHVSTRAEGAPQGADHAPPEEFRRLTRDLYVPPGDIFFWQGALRDNTDAMFDEISRAVKDERALTIELLYGDEEGGQRTITRFSLLAHQPPDGETVWLSTVSRHWNIDRDDPR
jgi:hypothetical protein